MIAGLGLIGGSFALALRDRALAEEILGVEKSPEIAEEAMRLGLADRIVGFEEGIAEADLVVLALSLIHISICGAASPTPSASSSVRNMSSASFFTSG